MLPGLPFEPKSDIPRLHKSSILGFHVQDRSDHPKPSELLGRLDIIAKPILLGLLLSPLEIVEVRLPLLFCQVISILVSLGIERCFGMLPLVRPT